MSLYHAILVALDDISRISDPTARVSAVKELWDQTRRLVVSNIDSLELRTLELKQMLSSSANPAEKRQIKKLSKTHQGSLWRIKEFFIAYPQATGQPFEWEDMWNRISATSTNTMSAVPPPFADQEISTATSSSSDLAPGASSDEASDIPTNLPAAVDQVTGDTIGTSHVSTRTCTRLISPVMTSVVTLSDWKRLVLSAEERKQIPLMIIISVLFRNCGMGSPTEYEEPLQLLKSLQASSSEADRAAIIQELVMYTRSLILQYQQPIRVRHAQAMEKISLHNNGVAKTRKSRVEPGYVFRTLDQAFKRMNEFFHTYPDFSALSPEEQDAMKAEDARSEKCPPDSKKGEQELIIEKKLATDDKGKSSESLSIMLYTLFLKRMMPSS